MAFHTAVFPTDIGYGSSLSICHNTSVVVMNNGREQRISKWSRPQRKYDISYGIRSDEDLYNVQKFYMAREGGLHGFLFTDPLDNTTNADGRTAPMYYDHTIGLGDGSTTTWQLSKTYPSGPVRRKRLIEKPISQAATHVGLDGVNKTSGWSVSTSTGIITFSSAPTYGQIITAGCRYYVPVRFGDEVDAELLLTLDNYKQGAIPSIPLYEIPCSAPSLMFEDEYFMGGGVDLGVLPEATCITPSQGRSFVADAGTGGSNIFLEDPSNYPPGGPYFIIHNIGTSTGDDIPVSQVQFTAGTPPYIGAIEQTTTGYLFVVEDSNGDRAWILYADDSVP